MDCYKRYDLDYFFAYPEDYAQASIEWEGNTFKRRPHHPAFEVIFVYSKADRTLNIFLAGDKTPIPELQEIFAETILNKELSPDPKDDRVYDLNPMKVRGFQFVFPVDSIIRDVRVTRIRLQDLSTKEKVTLEIPAKAPRMAIYDLVERFSKETAMYVVTQVGVKVTLVKPPFGEKDEKTRRFNIGWPNSCSLKHDDQDLLIRKMLVDSSIEGVKVEEVEVDGVEAKPTIPA